MRYPKVSIIIPVFNGSNYLKHTIDSALKQSYKNLEVIVVNDGSNDRGRTEKIAKSYGNKIRYFRKQNGGVASALNYGISKMKGEWFSWLSHDDYYYPDKISKQIKLSRKHHNTKVIYTNTGLINAKNQILRTDNSIFPLKIHGGIWVLKTWIYACSLLVHRSCFKSIGLFDKKFRTTQDTEFIFRLLNRYTIYHVSANLTMRRDHVESDIHKLEKENVQETTELYKTFLKNHGINYFYKSVDDQKTSRYLLPFYYLLLSITLISHDIIVSSHALSKSIELFDSFLNPAYILKYVGLNRIRNILIQFTEFRARTIWKIHSRFNIKPHYLYE